MSKAYEPPERIIHGQVHPEVTKVTFSLWVLQSSLALGSACRIFSFAACATSGFSHSWSVSFDAIWKIPSGNHLADRMSQHSWPAWPSLWVPTHCVPGWSQHSSWVHLWCPGCRNLVVSRVRRPTGLVGTSLAKPVGTVPTFPP